MDTLPKSRIQCECEKKNSVIIHVIQCIYAGLNKRSCYDASP